MSRLLTLALLLAGLVALPVRAEMLTDDLNGVKIGMTPPQVIAVLKADYPDDPVVTTRPCAAAGRTCITSIAAGPPTNGTSAFFVEDLPRSPGTMRVYAAVSTTLSEPWTERDQAAWEALVSRDLGRPDCVQLGSQGRFRAWSHPGSVSACAQNGADLPLPESDDAPGANVGSILTYPLIWEFQASTGRLHQLVLIDLGFYLPRKQAAR